MHAHLHSHSHPTTGLARKSRHFLLRTPIRSR